MARKRYDVVYRSVADKWNVTHQQTTLSTHFTKEAAVSAGVDVAKRNAPSQLFIHRKDGTIEDERTYGDDPYPPRG
ncbi:DUF2188 domain-containing protein [Cellulosimicrobium cellulans]|uniref:DUF2188 domain-containing protein n=1 Tax=Cellulosimicrobium cellulans TaxID=1710 RepID=UPI002149DCB4|nr:DUF2188 domain-containing protein [Cellulosimicrobium cellulans]